MTTTIYTHGLHLDVYRHPNTDCTNNGISSRHTTLTLVGTGVPQVFPVTPSSPAVRLEQHNPGVLRIIPDRPAGGMFCGPMMGGNYAATSDSRFADLCEALLGHRFYGAVAIHDRYED